MNTKTCKKCGWEYPKDWPGRRCRFCNEPFPDGLCSVCGQYTEKLHDGMCTACKTKKHTAWRKGKMAAADEAYKAWLSSISEIPKPYTTLTESQWIEACRYFGGCAYCGSLDIDARSMFIPFSDGGRYCDWNIIPACEKCATARKAITNPFMRMDHDLYRHQNNQTRKYGFSLDRLQHIVDYLQPKIKRR